MWCALASTETGSLFGFTDGLSGYGEPLMHPIGIVIDEVAHQFVLPRRQGHGDPTDRAGEYALAAAGRTVRGCFAQAAGLVDPPVRPGRSLCVRLVGYLWVEALTGSIRK